MTDANGMDGAPHEPGERPPGPVFVVGSMRSGSTMLRLILDSHPNIAIGGELLHEIEYADWEEWEDHLVYLGPVIHYGQRPWWVTVTPLFQLTDVDDEPDVQTRLLFGINF